MWSKIIGAVGSVVGEPIKQWQERKRLKVEHRLEIDRLNHEANVATAQAHLEIAKTGQAQNYDLDRIAMKAMDRSWKDELVLLLFLLPLPVAFIPGMDVYVHAGFQAIEQMPDWYVAIVIGMVVVIYGLRGLLTAYLKKTSAGIR